MKNNVAVINGVENPAQLELSVLRGLSKDDTVHFYRKEDFANEVAEIPADTVFKFLNDYINTDGEYVRHYEHRYPNPDASDPADSDVVLSVFAIQHVGATKATISFMADTEWS